MMSKTSLFSLLASVAGLAVVSLISSQSTFANTSETSASQMLACPAEISKELCNEYRELYRKNKALKNQQAQEKQKQTQEFMQELERLRKEVGSQTTASRSMPQKTVFSQSSSSSKNTRIRRGVFIRSAATVRKKKPLSTKKTRASNERQTPRENFEKKSKRQLVLQYLRLESMISKAPENAQNIDSLENIQSVVKEILCEKYPNASTGHRDTEGEKICVEPAPTAVTQ